MVFRAMVRDDAHFYDPLGLVSRGTEGRFPGRRECLSLRHALLHLARLRLLAGEGRRLDPARRRQRTLLRRQVPQVFGLPLDQAWQDWIAFEHEFQRRNLDGGPQVPDHAAPHARRQARWARSRACTTTRRPAMLYGAFRYPGVVEHVGALDTRDGSHPAACRHQARDALQGRVVRLRPGKRHGVLHQRQSRAARPDGGRREDRAGANAARGRAHRRDRRSIRSTAR